MRLINFSYLAHSNAFPPVIGLVIGPWDKWEYVIDLNAAGSLEGHKIPNDTSKFIDVYSRDEILREFVEYVYNRPDSIKERRKVVYHLEDIKLHPPIRPTLLRDFIGFRKHIEATRRARGLEVPKEWDSLPAYYIGNHLNIIGPDDLVPHANFLLHDKNTSPNRTSNLDYEAEIGYVLGAYPELVEGTDSQMSPYLFGYTIFNDFSMRDLQMISMGVGLGPSFGKDWANSLGSCIVTPDEIGDIFSKRIIIRINEEERLNTVIHDAVSTTGGKWYWSFAEMCSFVSFNQRVYCGEVWGSGTIPRGCELEKGNMASYLKSGDIVEIQVEGIGTLRNTIA